MLLVAAEVYSLRQFISYFQESHSRLEHHRNQWNQNPHPVMYSGLRVPRLVRGSLPSTNQAACPALPPSGMGQANPAEIPPPTHTHNGSPRSWIPTDRKRLKRQSHWRVGLQTAPPSGKGQCGCRVSCVNRHFLERSPFMDERTF